MGDKSPKATDKNKKQKAQAKNTTTKAPATKK